MAVPETTLPHRVANSARDLARSTISGIENEMSNPEAGKQAGGSSQIFRKPEKLASESFSARPHLSSRGSSFRTQASASASKAAEEDFDHFQEQKDFNDVWNPYKLIHDRMFFELDHSGENSPAYYEAITSYIERESIAANNRIDDAAPQNLDIEASKVNENSAHSAAMRRLDQIGSHLQRNLSMQMTRQNIDVQALNMSRVVSMTHETLETHQDLLKDQVSQENYVAEPAEQVNHIAIDHKALHPQPEQPPQPSQGDEEDAPDFKFHCPYYACHQNLLRLGSDSASANQCVHVGCNFRAEASDSWAAHVKMPHHDLQGSSAMTEG